MRTTAIFCFALAAVVAAFGLVNFYRSNPYSVPVPVVEIMPEQSHHVVFLRVCGVLEGVLLTTNPPILLGSDKLADPLTLELMREALDANRYMAIQHWRGYCPNSTATIKKIE